MESFKLVLLYIVLPIVVVYCLGLGLDTYLGKLW